MHQLEFVWFGTDLPCRPSRSTYDLYQQVPFIPEDKTRDLQFLDHSQVEQSQELALLEKLDQSLLPKELIMILSNASLQRQVPSCTACYFDLEEPFVVKALQTTLLLFYRDQQDCLLWYYAMDGPYQGSVIASNLFGFEDEQEVMENTWIVSGSVAEFIARIWAENLIWFGKELPPFAQWYLEEIKRLKTQVSRYSSCVGFGFGMRMFIFLGYTR